MKQKYYVFSGKHGFEVRAQKQEGKVLTHSLWLNQKDAEEMAQKLQESEIESNSTTARQQHACNSSTGL
jgi:hypothetical protein